jgi:rhomboid protease GluP
MQKPLLTPLILGILVGIFLLMTVSPQTERLLIEQGAKVSELIYQGEWWRLITATFLHGGLLHILFNGYALYAIGMDLEAFLGRARFLAIYAISGLAGSVASFIFSPFGVMGVGASGAIFGLIGALGVYFGLHRRLFGKIGQAQFWNIIVVIALNVGLGFSGIFPIDNSAHVGGLLAGAAAGYVLCPRYTLGEWSASDTREVVDVNKSGLMWLATILLGLVVVAIFLVALLAIRADVFVPNY